MDKLIDLVGKITKKKEPPKNIDNVNFITTIKMGDKIIRIDRNDFRKRNQAGLQ